MPSQTGHKDTVRGFTFCPLGQDDSVAEENISDTLAICIQFSVVYVCLLRKEIQNTHLY